MTGMGRPKHGDWGGVGWLVALIVLLFMMAIAGRRAPAHDSLHYIQAPPDWQKWFGEAVTTQESRARLAAQGFPYPSCCNHADRVKAEFRIVKDPSDPLGYRDEWWYLKKATDPMHADEWVKIPNDVIHHEDDPNMPGQLKVEGVLFVYNGIITCFWPPQEGG